MANPFLNMPASTSVGAFVRLAKSLARIGYGADAVSFLGGDNSGIQRDRTLAHIVTQTVREFQSLFPTLNVVSTTSLSTTANQRYTTLPSTLRHSDILGLYWYEEPETNHPIFLISKHDAENMPQGQLEDSSTVDFPRYAYIDWEQQSQTGKLHWVEMPSAARDFKLVYRAAETAVTSIDVAPDDDPTLTATLSLGNSVQSVTGVPGGTGFSSAPTVVFTSLDVGEGAEAVATINAVTGVVTAISIVQGGADYTVAPAVTLSGGRTVVPIPDAMIECAAHLLAQKIQTRNIGGTGVDAQALGAEFKIQSKQWANEIASSPLQMRDATFGFAGIQAPQKGAHFADLEAATYDGGWD